MNSKLLRAAGLAAIVAHPLLYCLHFAGDAQVHLVFAEAAARGRFFEFNPGEITPGVTSPGYMLVLALLFRALPITVVPIAVKLLNLAAWYVFCWFVYRIAAIVTRDKRWAFAVLLVTALMPGSAYNANVGMENGLFAAVLWGWLVGATRWQWFDSGRLDESANGQRVLLTEVVLGTLLGIGCWLRPEGFVVATIAHLVRLSRGRPAFSVARILGILVLLVLAGGVLLFHWRFTGHWIPTSALSRVTIMASRRWGGDFFAFYPGFSLRLLAYLPITIFFLIGCHRVVVSRSRDPIVLFAMASFWVFFVAYSVVLGSAHLARYVLFVMPMMIVIAAIGAQSVCAATLGGDVKRRNRRDRWLLSGAALLACVYVVEAGYRWQTNPRESLLEAMRAPAQRHAYSDALLARLGETRSLPVSLGCESVQIRYQVDERFVIRSLDGRVDPVLLDYVRNGQVDHIGYIKHRHIDFLVEQPSYNPRADVWSLRDLRKLAPGASMQREGVRFRRHDSTSIYAVDLGQGPTADGPLH